MNAPVAPAPSAAPPPERPPERPPEKLGQTVPLLAYAGWLVAAVFFFYAWVLRVAPSITVEPLMRDFAVGGAIVGNLSAVYFWAYAALQIPCGLFTDRWGPRRVLTVAILATGLGCAVMGLAPSIELAYAGRALIGFGAAFAFVGGMVIAALWLPARRFAFFSGVALAVGLAGGVVGQGPLAAAVAALGWRDYMIVLAGWALIHALLAWLLIRDRPRSSEPGGADGATPAAEPMRRSLGRALRRPQNYLLAAFAFLLSVPILAFGGLWGVPYTVARFGVDTAAAGFAMAAMLLGVACGGPLWGLLSDRLGRRKPVLLAGGVLGLAAIGVAIYAPGLPFDAFRVCVFLAGFGASAMVTAFALGREHNDARSAGTALGLINMCTVLSGAVAQPLIGLLLDLSWTGETVSGARVYAVAAYENAFLLLPGAFAAGLLVWLALRETHARPFSGPGAA
ncbi:MAG: MFS transporter [Rhodospirillaceae bacterium]|nr:MFS transporter [Rhodospirillaceae bacterium]